MFSCILFLDRMECPVDQTLATGCLPSRGKGKSQGIYLSLEKSGKLDEKSGKGRGSQENSFVSTVT